MSDAEHIDTDDYLSDKFIAAALSNQTVTYAQRRRQALRESELKNAQNRKKSRRQLEEESLKEGLSKSLFEKAAESQDGDGNKAMSMMLKMGYKPGQSLGLPIAASASEEERTAVAIAVKGTTTATEPPSSQARSEHLVEPIRVEIWSGREGVGKRKRNVSPTVAAKLAKLVKQDATEEQMRGSYRERAREEYEEKRAEGRLRAARLTCMTLDEEAGKKFNVSWLDPQDPETFPQDLLDVLTSQSSLLLQGLGSGSIISQEERLRRQMQADALLGEADEDEEATENIVIDESSIRVAEWPEDILQEVKMYISANARARLKITLDYLRSTYLYCFWCGTKYEDAQDMEKNCSGLEEEDHD